MRKSQNHCKLLCLGFAFRVRGCGVVLQWAATSWIIRQQGWPPSPLLRKAKHDKTTLRVFHEMIQYIFADVGLDPRIYGRHLLGPSWYSIGLGLWAAWIASDWWSQTSLFALTAAQIHANFKGCVYGKSLWCDSFNFPSNLLERRGIAHFEGSTTTTNSTR